MIQYKLVFCNQRGVFLICARGLTKRYGDKLALDNAGFVIGEGQVVGMLGTVMVLLLILYNRGKSVRQ